MSLCLFRFLDSRIAYRMCLQKTLGFLSQEMSPAVFEKEMTMQELNIVEVAEVSGAAWVQVTGFAYYVLSGGKIIFKNTDTGETMVF